MPKQQKGNNSKVLSKLHRT